MMRGDLAFTKKAQNYNEILLHCCSCSTNLITATGSNSHSNLDLKILVVRKTATVEREDSKQNCSVRVVRAPLHTSCSPSNTVFLWWGIVCEV